MELRKRIPTDVPPGVYVHPEGLPGDNLVEETAKKVHEKIEKNQVTKWTGNNRLFIIVSRIRPTDPIRIEALYLVGEELHSFFVVCGKNVVDKGVDKVFEEIDKFPKTPGILRTKSLVYIKAQPREGQRFLLL